MTTPFTPGPWRYDWEPGYCGELIAADGTSICTFSDEPKPKDALVLSAAPDLLAAVELMLPWLEDVPRAWEEVTVARAALAKARGET